MRVPKGLEISIASLSEISDSQAALFKGLVKIAFSGEQCDCPWGVCVFIRTSHEPFVMLQCAYWPPKMPRYRRLHAEDGKEVAECSFEPIYVGNKRDFPENRKFEIYAVALREPTVHQLMSLLRKDSLGQPYLVRIDEIELYDRQAVVSRPVSVEVDWDRLQPQKV